MTAGPLRLEDADGIQALDPNQLMSLVQGNSVVSGLTPSYSGTGMDVDVASGTALVNGTEQSVSATTVTLSDGDGNNPRKDLVVIDSTGSVKVYEGTAEPPVPKGQTKFKTARPAPEDLDDKDEVAVAEVWVPTGATSLQTSFVRDRRLISDLEASTAELHGDLEMNNNSINNFNYDHEVPVGGIIAWDKSRANTPALPANYAECNGQTISDADSPYDGQTLPDLNGNNRFLRGNGTSGGTGGVDSVTLSVSEMPSHNHSYTQTNNNNVNGDEGFDSANSGAFSSNTGDTGGDAAHENRPPYYNTVMVMRIK